MALPEAPGVPPLNKGGKPRAKETIETIVVASPGPVVNRNPTCPREPRNTKEKQKNKV